MTTERAAVLKSRKPDGAVKYRTLNVVEAVPQMLLRAALVLETEAVVRHLPHDYAIGVRSGAVHLAANMSACLARGLVVVIADVQEAYPSSRVATGVRRLREWGEGVRRT